MRTELFSVGGREGAKQTCTTCRGQGIQIITRQIGPNMMQRMQQVCKDCSGEGKSNHSSSILIKKIVLLKEKSSTNVIVVKLVLEKKPSIKRRNWK